MGTSVIGSQELLIEFADDEDVVEDEDVLEDELAAALVTTVSTGSDPPPPPPPPQADTNNKINKMNIDFINSIFQRLYLIKYLINFNVSRDFCLS